MFNTLIDAYKLAKLQRERAQVSKDVDKEQKRLVAGGVPEDEATTQATQMHKGDFRVAHSTIAVFLSDQMVREAERLQVPVPSDEKYWIRLKYAEHLHLSEEGIELSSGNRYARRRRHAAK